jgi:hypothetical protein
MHMKIQRNFICFALIVVVCSCREQSPEEYGEVAKQSGRYFEEDKKKNMNNFTFPDSTLSKLIIASYYEEDAGAHSIMFYTDAAKMFGKVIRYFPDKTVVTDNIKCIGDKQFVSVIKPEIKYMMEADRVIYTCWRGDHGGIQLSFDHLRTDIRTE